MSIGSTIQAWRLSKRQSVAGLAAKAGLPSSSLEAIESGELDPQASTLESLARALGIPVPWLYGDPKQLTLLATDPDGEPVFVPSETSVDPVTERVLQGSKEERELYVLLTSNHPPIRLLKKVLNFVLSRSNHSTYYTSTPRGLRSLWPC
jgi:transcriptional regulator with XRE-family HTH domain